MKLPNPFRRKPKQDATPIDLSIERQCIYRRFKESPGTCPQCGEMLHQRTQTYLVATRRGAQLTDTFVMGNDTGWFCPACPTVVVNAEQLEEMLAFPKPDWDPGSEFAVLGIIDLDAIPPEQSHLPLDQIDALPLVPFNTPSRRNRLARLTGQSKKRTKRSKRRKGRRKKKRR
jgi:hypothetical protein